MYAEMPPTPGYSEENSELLFSRGVSMVTNKSADKSDKSRYNARMELFDRAGASVVPSERFEPPTPSSDIENDAFMLERRIPEEYDDSVSPFMKDPFALFDEDQVFRFDRKELVKGVDNSMNRGLMKVGDSPQKSFEDLRLKERNLTDLSSLSQVGPLPKFMTKNSLFHNVEEVSSADSAIGSGAVSVSEYGASHFSEKMTMSNMSHLDMQSSRHSQISDDINNMFDVEHVLNLDYEGEVDDFFFKTNGNKNVTRMQHELADLEFQLLNELENLENIKNQSSSLIRGNVHVHVNSMGLPVLENNYLVGLEIIQGLETIQSMGIESEEEHTSPPVKEEERENRPISVIITPRGSNMATPSGSVLGFPDIKEFFGIPVHLLREFCELLSFY
ncbi:hypothetical protein DPMN_184120 [Dreissena polymorpha]|uniref:Uncharacterized protein n=1 Tax=Dreissena polymorpha TaxID=45954 RepID=A0A9D4I654_DREPO|nr:hypothetical protein DPMN_184120 [Dreissena polymorpha]